MRLPAKFKSPSKAQRHSGRISKRPSISDATSARPNKRLRSKNGDSINPDEIPPQGFPKFVLLPTEIQRMIWYMALPDPRLLHLHIHLEEKAINHRHGRVRRGRGCGCSRSGSVATVAYSFTASLLPTQGQFHLNPSWIENQKHDVFGPQPSGPALLAVCKESREVALSRYQLAFGGKHILPVNVLKKKKWERLEIFHKRIWIDFERDFVFLDATEPTYSWPQKFRGFLEDDIHKIKRLALGMTHWIPRGLATNSYFPVELPYVLKEFKGVEELLIYDDNNEIYIDETAEPLSGTVSNVVTQRNCSLSIDRNVLQSGAVAALEEARGKDKEWTQELPEVRIMRLDSLWNSQRDAIFLQSHRTLVRSRVGEL